MNPSVPVNTRFARLDAAFFGRSLSVGGYTSLHSKFQDSQDCTERPSQQSKTEKCGMATCTYNPISIRAKGGSDRKDPGACWPPERCFEFQVQWGTLSNGNKALMDGKRYLVASSLLSGHIGMGTCNTHRYRHRYGHAGRLTHYMHICLI